jgi:hypothetical protein
LLEEKENADSDDDGRADKGADRASRATASWVIAHRNSSLRVLLSRNLLQRLKPLYFAYFYVAVETATHKSKADRKSKASRKPNCKPPNQTARSKPFQNSIRSELVFCCVKLRLLTISEAVAKHEDAQRDQN